MCAPIAGFMAASGLMEQFGDPLGTKKRRDEEKADKQKSSWAREDQIRQETFQHEQSLADKGYGPTPNRDKMRPSGGQGGGKNKYSGGAY